MLLAGRIQELIFIDDGDSMVIDCDHEYDDGQLEFDDSGEYVFDDDEELISDNDKESAFIEHESKMF
ncbi:unnamed protein product, partial [Rotaria magnacalcarata]